MSRLSRRALLGGTGAALLAGALPILLSRRSASAAPKDALVADKAREIDLLGGFSYVVIDRVGQKMSDAFRVPGRPDGMACFERDGHLVLMRNHENHPEDDGISAHPGQAAPKEAFDAKSRGGVTRVVLDPKTLEVKRSNLVLTGTNRNCAGGTSPLGYLSCEENVDPGHGWVFLCDPDADSVRAPQRIDAYGRFYHEAAVVDPATGIGYLTEDRDDGCFYRFVPRSRPGVRPTAKELFGEGKLQALAIGDKSFDTATQLGKKKLDVKWIDVDDPTPTADDLRVTMRKKGAALVRRGEGIALSRPADAARPGEVFFCATTGGPLKAGQILRYDPAHETLGLVAQSEDRDVLDMPDNIVVTPSGLVIVAEDGPDPNYIRAITPAGKVVNLAKNARPGELTGLSMSPSGDTLFVSRQVDGVTFAIRGPFDSLG
jgi:secreted PhoX family phosphatase